MQVIKIDLRSEYLHIELTLIKFKFEYLKTFFGKFSEKSSNRLSLNKKYI